MSQVKCKTRVSNHGEVFTHEREVNAMLDLVKQETQRIDSRFLEPACGTGNFLAEVLDRKLEVVKNKYKKNQLEYERYAIIAISSIYGIDLLEDNVNECRNRLHDIFENEYKQLFKSSAREECIKSAEFILSKNIIWGNALTLHRVDKTNEPIVFSEWSLIMGSLIKRKEYIFKELIEYQNKNDNLFDDPITSDEGEEVFFPTVLKEYKPIHFLKVADV